MADPKPLASLSSGLLARKGKARPAMRRQGFDAMVSSGPASMDDLGWNDMGDDWVEDSAPSPAREQYEQLREQVEAPVRSEPVNPVAMLTPEPKVDSTKAAARVVADRPAPAPAEPDQSVRTVPPIAVRRARKEAQPRTGKTATGKAAFTLRLDPERHLKLRLAAALERQSAQLLVTRALDRFLDDLDDLDTVLEQLPQTKGS